MGPNDRLSPTPMAQCLGFFSHFWEKSSLENGHGQAVEGAGPVSFRACKGAGFPAPRPSGPGAFSRQMAAGECEEGARRLSDETGTEPCRQPGAWRRPAVEASPPPASASPSVPTSHAPGSSASTPTGGWRIATDDGSAPTTRKKPPSANARTSTATATAPAPMRTRTTATRASQTTRSRPARRASPLSGTISTGARRAGTRRVRDAAPPGHQSESRTGRPAMEGCLAAELRCSWQGYCGRDLKAGVNGGDGWT